MRIINPTLLVRVAMISARDILAGVAVGLILSPASIITIASVGTLSI
jgi:hypothetical protein